MAVIPRRQREAIAGTLSSGKARLFYAHQREDTHLAPSFDTRPAKSFIWGAWRGAALAPGIETSQPSSQRGCR